MVMVGLCVLMVLVVVRVIFLWKCGVMIWMLMGFVLVVWFVVRVSVGILVMVRLIMRCCNF